MRSARIRPPHTYLAIASLLLISAGLLRPNPCLGQERCGLAKDFMVQALEHIKTGATNEAEDGLQLLKHANEQCPSLGDAWYYRSLFERKLNQPAKPNYSLATARMSGSLTLDQFFTPFLLPTIVPSLTTNPP